MLFRFLIVWMTIFSASVFAQEAPKEAPITGKLTFDDEFVGLDLTKYDTAYWWGARWLGDGEEQVYVDRDYHGTADHALGLMPFSLVAGALQIQASIPSASTAMLLQGRKYISGLLTTCDHFSQLYGYFEIRAKFPAGKGYWPAFWLLPKILLPTPPEIDVVEVLGDRITTLFATVHWNDPTKQKIQSKGFPITVPDMSADFHRYGVLWTDHVVAWYFDGQRVAATDTPADLHNPMYLLLNLAVGGKWPGAPNASTQFPGNMLVSYIRVYALN